jgi:hypothetical protein
MSFCPLVRLALLAVLVAMPLSAAPQHEDGDDCDSRFIAFVGADAYQFSPRHEGQLGNVRLFTILSHQRVITHRDPGLAAWRLEIRGPEPKTDLVRVERGLARIETASGQALAEHYWDGRDAQNRLVPAGRYRCTFFARFQGDRGSVADARTSSDAVVVRYDLTPQAAQGLRSTLAATTCETQQNAPLEAGFRYNFYYGSTHGHSNYSDGGQPVTACASGNAYGSGNFTPADVYNYARNTSGLDYYLINEHNHLINDSVATNAAPVTEAKVRQRYHDGLNAANAATQDGAFVGLYGMEWGVLTNADQGHVTLIETPKLFGWETCTNCTGASAECTAGSNCYFDVFTPKRGGYLTMYQRSVENPSPAGALGIFCHPSSGEFDNLAFNANADNAMQGIAIRSGLAFATGTNCSDQNVASSDYSDMWKTALNKGFHVGPTADHDSHCDNYGQGLPNRTVYLLPNTVTPALTKAALLAAHRARHFFASEDSNAQLVFATGDGAHIMGDVFTAGASVPLRAAAYDASGEGIATLELWRSQVGAGIPAAAYRTFSGQSSFAVTETGTGTWFYWVHAVQNDGHDLWSSPMWITFGTGGCSDTTAPAVSVTAPAGGSTVSCADTVVRVTASDAGGIASAAVQVDGGAWNAATLNAGTWQWTWPSATATAGAHTLTARATDASCSANVGTSSPVSVTVSNTGCGGGGTSLDVSGWKLTQANSAGTYTLPAGTTIPADGYLVVGRSATRAAFETFWGRTLGANVVYLNSAGVMPVINGDETVTVANAAGTTIDGPTIAMAAAGGQSLRRNDPCAAAGTASSWTVGADTSATPGSGAGAGCGKGVVVNELSDASGTNNFVYEFVELHYETPGAADAQAPVTAITAPASGATVSGTTIVTASASDNVGVARVEFWLDGALQSTDTTSPWSWSWATTSTANGSHTLVSRAYDPAGNVGVSASVGVTVSNGPVTTTLFSDGAESATTGFTATGSTTTTVWTRQNSGAYAGAWRWRAGSSTGGNYGNGGDARLTTPSLSLAGATAATLTYAFWHSTESGFDFFSAEITSDGGTTWTALATASGNSSGYSAWAPLKSISLASYLGKTVKIRFRLTSDGSVTGVGAALDEVKVTKQ